MPSTYWAKESTRLLCVAVLTDRGLADRLLRDVTSTLRAFPAATDVDLAAATRCASVELRRRKIQDGLLAICSVLLVCGFFGALGNSGLAVLLFLSLVLAWVVVLVATLTTTKDLVDQFTRHTFTAAGVLGGTGTDDSVARPAAPDHNVTVYSGYSPFVGAGRILGSWSFSVDIATPAVPGGEPAPFGPDELRTHVVAGLRDLRWSGLHIEERLFVNGYDLVPGSPLLPDPRTRPVQSVAPDMFTHLLASADRSDSGENLRRYTCIRAAGWSDTLVFSLWLRFVVSSRSLYVESSTAVLTPVDKAYDLPEKYSALTGFQRVRSDLRTASVRTLPLLAASLPRTVRHLRSPYQQAREHARDLRLIRDGLPFDYGHGQTVREAIADANYQHYFQKTDKEMYAKTIEGRVLDLVAEFLAERGIDTKSIVDRQTTILNNGVMVTAGGRLTADNVAVGERSSIISRVTQAGQQAAQGTVKAHG